MESLLWGLAHTSLSLFFSILEELTTFPGGPEHVDTETAQVVDLCILLLLAVLSALGN